MLQNALCSAVLADGSIAFARLGRHSADKHLGCAFKITLAVVNEN